MCHLDRETSQAEMMKPRDLGAETEKKLISVSEGKLYVGSTVLTEGPSSDVQIGRPQAVLESKCISQDTLIL